jgi:transcriptional regulator with XRE-family HTH domain
MLGLSQSDVARLAGISNTGLNNIELGLSDPKVSTIAAIRAALESAGVEFIAENGGGAGVRLRR